MNFVQTPKMREKEAKWKNLIEKIRLREFHSKGVITNTLEGIEQREIMTSISELALENVKDNEKDIYKLIVNVKDISNAINKYSNDTAIRLGKMENDTVQNRLCLYEEIGDIYDKHSKLELVLSSNKEEMNKMKDDIETLKKNNDIMMADYMISMMII